MKSKITLQTLLIFLVTTTVLIAQQSFSPSTGGPVDVPRNEGACISDELRIQIKERIAQNRAQLAAEGRLQPINTEGNHPLFAWPVDQANGFGYNEVWSLTNYVDHNSAFPNQISDYDCGTRSYDTNSGYNHQGFDVINWPFWWKQMDLNQGINVAGADGQIIDKNDGSFDRNCAFNNDMPNYVALQHADGSVTWYLHMKEGGLTSKNIGDTVTQGEFLGVIGSSGSSTAPHLHFEVYDNNDNLIDPSIGSCNTLNSDSWWIDQKPYYTPAVNAVLTHTGFPDFGTCPTTETTNESNQFDLGDQVYYGVYLKDQRAGTQINLKITRPDSTILFEWDFDLVDDLQISYWMWNFPNDMTGEWTWEATYMGETATHTFNVGVLGTEENPLADTSLFPNPVSNELRVISDAIIAKIAVHDIVGREVYVKNSENAGIDRIDFPNVPNGVYFVSLFSTESESKTIKIIKN